MFAPKLSIWFKSPLHLAVIYLILLYSLALATGQNLTFAETTRFLAVWIGFSLPYLGIRLFKGTWPPTWMNFFISGLILLLLADPQTPWWLMGSLGFITAVIKLTLRLRHQPIFNPAATGLLITSYLGVPVSWWGVSSSLTLNGTWLSYLSFFIPIMGGLYLANLYRKLPIVVSGLSVFILILSLLNSTFPGSLLTTGPLWFFWLIMAVEPKTSPVSDHLKWPYGIVLGGLLAWFVTQGLTHDPYLSALLLTNVVFKLQK